MSIYENRIFYIGIDHPKKIVNILNNNKAVILIQDVENNQAEEILFLGKPVKLALGSLRLSRMGDACILPFVMSSNLSFFNAKKWQIDFYPPINAKEEHAKKMLVRSLEHMVVHYPQFFENWPLFRR